MTIENHAPENSCNRYSIYIQTNQKPQRNFRAEITGLYEFDEDDIENLLEGKYKAFEKGKYIFNVSVSRLKLITGERSAHSRSELLLYPSN